MKNRVPEVFLSEMFGELRIMEDDNKFYFCAADVCSALGYSNPSHELNIHCRHDGIKAGRTDVNGVPRIIKFISEGNVYRLICRSNKPERHKCYAILSHYSNEDIGTFDSVAICGGVHMSFESAKKAADEMLAVDKENGCHDDAVPYTLDDCKEFDDLPLYIAGEWVKDEFERYHNFYAVFEQDAAL